MVQPWRWMQYIPTRLQYDVVTKVTTVRSDLIMMSENGKQETTATSSPVRNEGANTAPARLVGMILSNFICCVPGRVRQNETGTAYPIIYFSVVKGKILPVLN
jgi:hypothetical protein